MARAAADVERGREVPRGCHGQDAMENAMESWKKWWKPEGRPWKMLENMGSTWVESTWKKMLD